MSERKYLQELTRQIKETCPGVYWKKLGDTFGGHKRLDVHAFWKGHGFIIEFKMAGESLPIKQAGELSGASGAAHTFIAEFYMEEEGRHARNVRFYPLGNAYLDKENPVILKYESGKYADLPGLLPRLLLTSWLS